jgi:chemotaxis protein CheZ
MTPAELKQLVDKLDTFETFVKRRFDEVSMEINATSQQIGHVENDIAGQFRDIMGVLAAISYKGDGTSQANAGMELEAVIHDTESAANNIMDAADRIAQRLSAKESIAQDGVTSAIRADVQTILLACTFQDLTSQRIKKAIENLQSIETRLSSTLEKMGIKPDISGADIIIKANETRQSQADIDALFN